MGMSWEARDAAGLRLRPEGGSRVIIGVMPPPASNPPAAPPVAPPGRTPAWEIALLFADQGELSEDTYLDVTRSTRNLVEFTDGQIEFLPMPTKKHQKLVWWLAREVETVAARHPGSEFVTAPYKLRIRPGKYREPDVLLLLGTSSHKALNDYATGADLVIEVVSADDPGRDYQRKRLDYAEAGVGEYWIVDPQAEKVTVLTLSDGTYRERGTFGAGEVATSVLLAGFTVDVSACLAAGE